MRRRMRDAMRARVKRFYDQRDMVAAYDELYQRHIKAETELPAEPVPEEEPV